jgi:hypothetical protein
MKGSVYVMVNKMLLAQLDSVFVTDPAISLRNFIRDNWAVVTGYTVPAAATVKFDTKFGEQKGFYNFVIIENMPVQSTPQILGGGRFRYRDVKRIQVMCLGPSAKNNKFQMEQHIESLLNGNLLALQTGGIDEFWMTEFTEIFVQPDPNITALMPTKIDQARSRALVTLIYDKYRAVA